MSEFDKALNLRPKSVDALHGYAGALMQRGDYAAALPVLERVTKMDASRARAWADLVRAKDSVAGPEQAVEILKKAPPAVAAKLNADLEYLSSLAALYQRAGDVITAKRIFERANALAGKTPGELPAPIETQLGGLNLQFGNVGGAVSHYKTAVENNPENLDAWEGFLLASNQAGEAGLALKTLESLPCPFMRQPSSAPDFFEPSRLLKRVLEACVSRFDADQGPPNRNHRWKRPELRHGVANRAGLARTGESGRSRKNLYTIKGISSRRPRSLEGSCSQPLQTGRLSAGG